MTISTPDPARADARAALPVDLDPALAPCLATHPPAASASSDAWLSHGPMPALDDEEAPALSRDLPPVVDAHVHLFPDRMFAAIWAWFDAHGWPIRHRLPAPAVDDEVLRALGDFGIEIVHQHPHRGLDGPRGARKFRAARGADRAGG